MVGLGSTVFATGQDIKGVVFTGRTSIVHAGSNFENNTINTSGIVTVISGGTFGNNVFNEPSGVTAVSCTNLDDLDDCVFNSDGTGHAVTLTSPITSDTSMAWKCTESGYAAQAGTTTDRTIKCSVNSEVTLTINVGTGKSTPSYYNTGTGTVNVVSGQVTVTFNTSPSITGYEYALYTVTASGSLAGAVEKQHVEVHNSSTFSYTYTYSAGTVLAVQLLFGNSATNDYEEYLEYYTLSSVNQTIPVNLTPDNNN